MSATGFLWWWSGSVIWAGSLFILASDDLGHKLNQADKCEGQRNIDRTIQDGDLADPDSLSYSLVILSGNHIYHGALQCSTAFVPRAQHAESKYSNHGGCCPSSRKRSAKREPVLQRSIAIGGDHLWLLAASSAFSMANRSLHMRKSMTSERPTTNSSTSNMSTQSASSQKSNISVGLMRISIARLLNSASSFFSSLALCFSKLSSRAAGIRTDVTSERLDERGE